MRLVSFSSAGRRRVGVLDGDEVVDVGAIEPTLPGDVGGVLAVDALGAVAGVVAAGRAPRVPLETVQLEAPVARPPKLLAIGLNYADHVAESGRPRPEHQLWFNKQSTCVVGPGSAVHVPRASAMVDYEGELAFVIGRRCRHVPASRAGEVIAGYTIMNDVSVRDWQFRTPTMTLGKSFDSHGPMGPWVVTGDELGDPHALRLRTWVSGNLRQDASTADMLFNCFEQVELLSTVCTLEPGDVISTGTPAGVGMAMQPPRMLRAGDVVRIEIDGIGVLENPVVDEPEDSARGF